MQPNTNAITNLLEANPVIAAVKDGEAAEAAAASGVGAVFLLGGDILTLPQRVAMLRDAGKKVFLHIDLIEGAGRDAAGVRYISRVMRADGVISTRGNLMKTAAEEGLWGVLRLFMLDSASLSSGMKLLEAAQPAMVELMPGLVGKAIQHFSKCGFSVIAGGMITTRQEAAAALAAGALAVSTSRRELWV